MEATLAYGSQKTQQDDKTTNIGGGIDANYFFTPFNQFSFILSGGVSYNKFNFKPDNVGQEDSSSDSFGAQVRPGINYFVSKNFALRATVGALSYRTNKSDFEGAEAQNNFGLNFNLSNINIGLTYKL